MDFALDCSVVLSWCFSDEFESATNNLQQGLLHEDRIIAPNLLQLELINSLLMGQRRSRISKADADTFIEIFFIMPLELESDLSNQSRRTIKNLAETHLLTAYDATYLELAIRRNLPLATKDKELAKAAKKEGIKCLI